MLANFANPSASLVAVRAFATGSGDAAKTAVWGSSIHISDILTHCLPLLADHLASQYYLDADTAVQWLEQFIAEKAWRSEMPRPLDCHAGAFRKALGHSLHCFASIKLRWAGEERCSVTTWSRWIEELYGDDLEQACLQAARGFEIVWARAILAESLRRMENFCLDTEQSLVWELFVCRILQPMLRETKPPSYPELVQRFGLLSPSQTSRLLRLGRDYFGLSLRGLVSEFVRDESARGQEIRELKELLRDAV
jgi:hypothetical protein